MVVFEIPATMEGSEANHNPGGVINILRKARSIGPISRPMCYCSINVDLYSVVGLAQALTSPTCGPWSSQK